VCNTGFHPNRKEIFCMCKQFWLQSKSLSGAQNKSLSGAQKQKSLRRPKTKVSPALGLKHCSSSLPIYRSIPIYRYSYTVNHYTYTTFSTYRRRRALVIIYITCQGEWMCYDICHDILHAYYCMEEYKNHNNISDIPRLVA
jgi:hypothetical protein